jgi:hypothetical protein
MEHPKFAVYVLYSLNDLHFFILDLQPISTEEWVSIKRDALKVLHQEDHLKWYWLSIIIQKRTQ